MHHNLWKLSAVTALHEAILLIPIVVPFFEENGLSLQQIFLLQGIFAAALVILEIPTGYIADRWGRKSALIASSVFGIFGILAYALGTDLHGFILAELLLAACFGLQSGTIDAMLFETLAALGKSHEYRREVGKRRFYGHTCQAAASVLGGILAIVSLRFTVWLTLVPYTLCLMVSFMLVEPPRQKILDGGHLAAIVRIMRSSLLHNPVLRSIIMLFAALSTLTLALVWFTQAYQVAIGMPIWLFGAVHAAITLGMGISARIAHCLEKRVDDRLVLIAASMIIIASYLGLGLVLSAAGLLLFFLGRVTYGIFGTVTTDMVNRLTTSEVRATVLSIQSFGHRLLFLLVSPLLGTLADTRGLNQSLALVGLAGGFVLACLFLAMRASWSRIPS